MLGALLDFTNFGDDFTNFGDLFDIVDLGDLPDFTERSLLVLGALLDFTDLGGFV